jgi:hypothetical protein
MTYKEVESLYHRVITEFRARRQLEDSRAMMAFSNGDKVEFDGRRGRLITGTVERVNQKTVSVTNCSDGRSWRVPGSLLRKI